VSTPEGLIKKDVKRILNEYDVYYFMPVQMGYGAAGLDFHCIIKWKKIPIAFMVETKAPGKELTARQSFLSQSLLENYNVITFIVDSPSSLLKLERWLQKIRVTQ
jgi:hypothetical protein